MGVIIGTAIGSTITVQLISLDLSQFCIPMVATAFFVYFRAKKSTVRHFAQVALGFGIVFLGIRLISFSAHHFAENPFLQIFFANLRENPGYSLFVSMVFCAFVQSSAITIGLAMSLAQAGAISFYDAMIWVYGANIGTTSVALLAASNGNYIGKQVAWAHFFYKTLSVIVFYPFTPFAIEFLKSFETTVARSIANGHLYFNLASALVFLPFLNAGARIIQNLFPKDPSEEFGVEFLSRDTYKSSALAVSYANREIMRAADITLSMIRDSLLLFEKYDPELISSIRNRDNQVDFLYRETKMFLLDHANQSHTVVHQNVMGMIMFLSDLERAADAIDINVLSLAIKKNSLKVEFSEEGLKEIRMMHEELVKLASLTINAFQNKEMCKDAVQMKRAFTKLEVALREHHVERLNRGIRETINTSSIHMDLLSEYRRIGSLLANHAYSHSS
jgi:phosphate:Na+ symporter